ncbi:MFS transporter [Oceanirhabdus seepicola]|uniref:MFS transporter n=1 Tax=Oceanirhabdus seepicola TaxID=2828781 RepID=A0A9J6P789_9CLOT|nr:MFS transporter [Oceanirhabdus seepicola]MCM1991360.1 MFS transporter [Oceanirhabdus seepicola]
MEEIVEIQTKSKSTRLLAVSVGHFMNDFYVAIVPPILFLFATALSLNMTEQAVVAAVITCSGSFAQPIVGYIVDERGKPWLLILSVVWIAVLMSISGLVTNFYLLVFITGLGALASSLYHPLGSALAVSLGNSSRGKSLAIFMTIGGFAASVSPIITIPIVQKYGLAKLAYLMIPGFIVAGMMYMAQIQKTEFQHKTVKKEGEHGKLNFYTLKWLSALVFIATTRIMIARVLISFGVQLLSLKNIDLKSASIVLFLYLLINSVGTLVGGHASDKFGYKKTFIISNFVLSLSLVMLVFDTGISVVIWFVLIAFSSSSANTSNIVITQELIPQNLNLATGLIMGLAGGIGGLGIILYGRIADSQGLIFATTLCLIPAVLASIFTMLLPDRQNNGHS